jgi:hypothetical protein
MLAGVCHVSPEPFADEEEERPQISPARRNDRNVAIRRKRLIDWRRL